MTAAHRWRPPGPGWIRTADYGHTAVWMRPTPAGIDVAAYLGSRYDGLAELWVVSHPHGTRMPYIVMDKAHRIRWAGHVDPSHPEHGALNVWRRTAPATHRGHRRLNHNRGVWRWPLPRRLQVATEQDGKVGA